MQKHQMIFAMATCCLVALFTNRTLSQMLFRPPDLRGMDRDQVEKAMKQWQAEKQQVRLEEELKLNEYGKIVLSDFQRQVLRIDRQQWQNIGSKCDKVTMLREQAGFRMFTGVRRDMKEGRFYWRRISENDIGRRAKTLGEMTECERIAEELADLLEDENAQDEAIKNKMNALEQARERAKKELAEARQELRDELTPRQEAVLVVMRTLD